MKFLIPLLVLIVSSAITGFIMDRVDGATFFVDAPIVAILMVIASPLALFKGEITIGWIGLIPWFLTYLTYANLKKKDDEIKKDELEKEVERRLNEVKKNEESN